MNDISEQNRYRELQAEIFIANHTLERGDKSYVMWWKARRNANLALKARLRGIGARLTLDTKTMSVVTDSSMMRKFYTPVQKAAQKAKRTTKRKPKGMRYAR
jgi:hypothetical protein